VIDKGCGRVSGLFVDLDLTVYLGLMAGRWIGLIVSLVKGGLEECVRGEIGVRGCEIFAADEVCDRVRYAAVEVELRADVLST